MSDNPQSALARFRSHVGMAVSHTQVRRDLEHNVPDVGTKSATTVDPTGKANNRERDYLNVATETSRADESPVSNTPAEAPTLVPRRYAPFGSRLTRKHPSWLTKNNETRKDPWIDRLKTILDTAPHAGNDIVQALGADGMPEWRVTTLHVIVIVLGLDPKRITIAHTRHLHEVMNKLGWSGPKNLRFLGEQARGYYRAVEDAEASYSHGGRSFGSAGSGCMIGAATLPPLKQAHALRRFCRKRLRCALESLGAGCGASDAGVYLYLSAFI